MRPVVALWLVRHGLPAWLAPDYFLLATLATVAGSALALRAARREGADVRHAARALAATYLGTLVGGYLFEILRQLPAALAAGSLARLAATGRAAYGGLLFGTLAALAYLRLQRQPVGAFFDRAATGTGLIYFLVRIGCFLAGCDYGVPSALPWAVRFPPGSLAAVEHARLGWVAAGGASLPVHPTQLYESLLGLAAAAVAHLAGRWQPRLPAGSRFLAFLACYAAGRFAIELVRGDGTRGALLGLSTAQHVSIGLVLAVAAVAVALARRTSVGAPSSPARSRIMVC